MILHNCRENPIYNWSIIHSDDNNDNQAGYVLNKAHVLLKSGCHY